MRTIVGARGYGIELRERIVNAVQNGDHMDTVAQRFGVHRATVQVYVVKATLGTLHQTGTPTGRPRLLLETHEAQLLTQVKASPDATLEEHAQMLVEATGFRTSRTTIHRFFARQGITFKKNGVRQ
jgi:transposase